MRSSTVRHSLGKEVASRATELTSLPACGCVQMAATPSSNEQTAASICSPASIACFSCSLLQVLKVWELPISEIVAEKNFSKDILNV